MPRIGENGVSYFRNRVCSTAGMEPVVLEKWQPLQTTLTAPLESLSTPRLEVWDTSKGAHGSQEALGELLFGILFKPAVGISTCDRAQLLLTAQCPCER